MNAVFNLNTSRIAHIHASISVLLPNSQDVSTIVRMTRQRGAEAGWRMPMFWPCEDCVIRQGSDGYRQISAFRRWSIAASFHGRGPTPSFAPRLPRAVAHMSGSRDHQQFIDSRAALDLSLEFGQAARRDSHVKFAPLVTRIRNFASIPAGLRGTQVPWEARAGPSGRVLARLNCSRHPCRSNGCLLPHRSGGSVRSGDPPGRSACRTAYHACRSGR